MGITKLGQLTIQCSPDNDKLVKFGSCADPSPTATPTPTPTSLPATATPAPATATPTPTPTSGGGGGSSPTATPTPTPTSAPATATPTPTPTSAGGGGSPTATATPTPTSAPASTATPTPTPVSVWFQMTDCADSSTKYSQEYVEGQFAINERVTAAGGLTLVITGWLYADPSTTLYAITSTGLTGCPAVPTATPTPTPTSAPSLYSMTLEYGSVDCATVCYNYGSNPSGTFWLDTSNFSVASNIYQSNNVNDPAPANYYTDGTVCRPGDGSGNLGSSSSC